MLKLYKLLSAKYKWYSAITVFLTLVQVAAFLVIPILIGNIVGFIAAKTQIPAGTPAIPVEVEILKIKFTFANLDEATKSLSIWFVIFLVIGTISSLLASVAASYISNAGARDIRQKLWEHLGRLSEKDIETFSHAKILTRFTIDINRIQIGLMSFLRTMIIGPCNLIFGLVFGLLTDLNLSIVFGVMIPVLGLTMIISGAVIAPLFKKEQKNYDDINNESQESILGAKVIKSYNLEHLQNTKFEKANLSWKQVSKKSWSSFNSTFNFINLFANLAVAFILFVVGKNAHLTAKDPITFSKVIANATTFVNYVMFITIGVVMSSFVIFNMFRARVSSKRIMDIMNTTPDIAHVVSDNKVTDGLIEFDHVSFRYYDHSEKNVLEDVTFSVKPGEVLGIIGPTGSGKSTIAKLMNLDFQTIYGTVKIDGNDIKTIDTYSLRKNVSHVYQTPLILSGTIASNLNLANPDADLGMMENAAKNACAFEYINRFEKKFDHEVVQKGANLSGGQKQRLAIAQGIIKRPKILILDDSTSALDAKTEAQVRKNIREEFKKEKITTVIIAQKISSIIDADNILVLEHGKIIGQGKHEELLKTNNVYREIALSQLGGEDV
ncbi:ABC transporter ATP-binding protein [[Mycoplasma] falconis]|uniref:ABC transporter ATP-binding protein n=1 Tax=[Mycoplasma] falconis TaxID=92403 RepID=A0A501XBU9_9BACT|nr:ABC transporter ATP-binding protein [[Mycoplasma] falconis]TPE58031.1 ABC transporter ATP-binding protein [[Mycoplasma] falconis]